MPNPHCVTISIVYGKSVQGCLAHEVRYYSIVNGGSVVRYSLVVTRLGVAEWLVIGESDGVFFLRKSDSDAQVEIPTSFIEKVHRFSGNAVLLQLSGRLQWDSVHQNWQLMPEKPESGQRGQHGFSKYVDFDYPRDMNYVGGFAWCREDRLAQCLSRGRYVFYDADGNYLRVGGPDVDQILVSDRP